MKIPFLDLKSQYKSIKNEIDEKISFLINNAAFILGEDLKGFEKEFSTYPYYLLDIIQMTFSQNQ